MKRLVGNGPSRVAHAFSAILCNVVLMFPVTTVLFAASCSHTEAPVIGHQTNGDGAPTGVMGYMIERCSNYEVMQVLYYSASDIGHVNKAPASENVIRLLELEILDLPLTELSWALSDDTQVATIDSESMLWFPVSVSFATGMTYEEMEDELFVLGKLEPDRSSKIMELTGKEGRTHVRIEVRDLAFTLIQRALGRRIRTINALSIERTLVATIRDNPSIGHLTLKAILDGNPKHR